MKKVSIFGLGYVGAVSAGCLANDGHTLIGVDQNHLGPNLATVIQNHPGHPTPGALDGGHRHSRMNHCR